MTPDAEASPSNGPLRGKSELSELCAALRMLSSEEEVERFLIDLTTPAERQALCERWRVARLLAGGRSYRDIAQQTGVSTTTVTRVARFLRDEPHGGYRLALERLEGGR